MFKFLLFLCFGSRSRTHRCTPMLGILEDAPSVCLLYMGTVCIRKAQRSSRDVFHSGSQKTRLPLSIGSLRVTRCPRPMEDNGADPEAVASLPSAGTAGDPTPPSRCSSRELCGSRWFLPSLRFKIVLGAWKVSINFPPWVVSGVGGSWAGARCPGCAALRVSCFCGAGALLEYAEPSPRAVGCMGGWKMCPAYAFPWLPEVIFQLFYGRGEPEGDSGLGLAARRETRVPSGSGAVEGGCGADLPAPDLLALGYPWGVPWGSPSSGCSSSLWHPSPSWTPSLLEGTPALCCAIAEASAQDPADVAVPGPASGADRGWGSEGAQAWLPTPVTGFHFHAAQKAFPPPLGPNLSLKQYFFSPSSHRFHNVSVQPKPVSSLCSIQPLPLKDPLVAPCGVDLAQRLGERGLAQASLGRAAAGFCSHLLISVLLLVTTFLLLCGVEWQFSFHSFAEFMGI